ncbi:MAG: diaminopimelate epimerase [Longimicrobiales bacterium]
MRAREKPEARDRPTVGRDFFKAHGHGNDYLVFEEAEALGDGLQLSPEVVVRICDRWRGPGGDGVVVIGDSAGPDLVSLRMYNPDGSEFERSGNGLRIAAMYLFEQGRVGHDTFSVEQAGSRVCLTVGRDVGPDGRMVKASMGPALFPDGPPFVASAVSLQAGVLPLEPGLDVVPVSMGNPHAVVFGDGWSREEVDRLGPKVATHPAFPSGTNVQFADAPEGAAVRIQIWERGVGRTASSGTSACAVAAAAIKLGLVPLGLVTIKMDGGDFLVRVPTLDDVTLEGPVQPVYRGRLADGFFDAVEV